MQPVDPLVVGQRGIREGRDSCPSPAERWVCSRAAMGRFALGRDEPAIHLHDQELNEAYRS